MRTPKTFEHSLVIQGVIEGLTPQQVLLRDSLAKEHSLDPAVATSVVKGEKKIEDVLTQPSV